MVDLATWRCLIGTFIQLVKSKVHKSGPSLNLSALKLYVSVTCSVIVRFLVSGLNTL